MLCLLVNSFRDKPFPPEIFSNWNRIQKFVNTNVNRFTREVQSLKPKIIDNQDLDLDCFMNIQDEFFNDNSKNLFKNLVTNKNLKTIVCFVYNTVNYVLEPKEKT